MINFYVFIINFSYSVYFSDIPTYHSKIIYNKYKFAIYVPQDPLGQAFLVDLCSHLVRLDLVDHHLPFHHRLPVEWNKKTNRKSFVVKAEVHHLGNIMNKMAVVNIQRRS